MSLILRLFGHAVFVYTEIYDALILQDLSLLVEIGIISNECVSFTAT